MAFWPTTAAGWGSLAGGVIEGLGTAFGGGKGLKKSDLRAQHELNLQYDVQRALNMPEYQRQGWERAGIHPLYAAGSPAFSPTSSNIGGFSANDANDMGQGLSRAAMAVADAPARANEAKLAELQLERGELENDLLRSQVARNVQQLGPPMPSFDTVKVPHEIFANKGGFMPGENPSHQKLHWNQSDKIRAMSESLNGAGLDDGPAQWYYQLTRTLPDMLKADLNSAGRTIKKSWNSPSSWKHFSKRWKDKEYWKGN